MEYFEIGFMVYFAFSLLRPTYETKLIRRITKHAKQQLK